MSTDSEDRIRHLEMIQGVINRMASNCFALKALAGTITAAVIAYASTESCSSSSNFAIAGLLPAVTFWLMDARYLRLEKMFRELFDSARRGKTESFDMNFSKYSSSVPSILNVARSWSVLWFYLTLSIVLVVLSFLA